MKVKAVFINKPGEVETRWVDYPHKMDLAYHPGAGDRDN